MAVSSKRGQKIYEIDPKNFNNLHMKGYIRTYFKDNSLNVATGVPILIICSDLNWVEICVNEEHPFYNLFRELSKDNEELYHYYLEEKNKEIVLRVNGQNLQEVKKFCKLDMRVRILLKEEVLYTSGCDPEYFNQWRFLLDINRIEFM